MGAICAGLAAWWLYREKFAPARPFLAAVGGILIVLGALWPRALTIPRRGWMAMAEQLSKITTVAILGVVFFFVVTPIGIFKRLFGWDPLERRRLQTAGAGVSYWRPYGGRRDDPKHFDRMY